MSTFTFVREEARPNYARYAGFLNGAYVGVVVRNGRQWTVNDHHDRTGLEPIRSLREGRERLAAKAERLGA